MDTGIPKLTYHGMLACHMIIILWDNPRKPCRQYCHTRKYWYWKHAIWSWQTQLACHKNDILHKTDNSDKAYNAGYISKGALESILLHCYIRKINMCKPMQACQTFLILTLKQQADAVFWLYTAVYWPVYKTILVYQTIIPQQTV